MVVDRCDDLVLLTDWGHDDRKLPEIARIQFEIHLLRSRPTEHFVPPHVIHQIPEEAIAHPLTGSDSQDEAGKRPVAIEFKNYSLTDVLDTARAPIE